MDYFGQFLSNFPVVGWLYAVLQVIFIILDVLLFGIFLLALVELIRLRPRIVYDPRKWRRYVKKKKEPELQTPIVKAAWTKVEARLKDGSPDSLRLAIMEADGTVDEVLARMGLSGETFADRLGHLDPSHYTTIDKVWDAHRVRNNLVHTPDFAVSEDKAQEAITNYEAFLKEVKAL